MKKYLGVKVIQAEECLGLYNKCVDTDSEHCGQEVPGYKVIYDDGYTSWSPKDVFEKAYREVGDYKSLILDANTITGEWSVYNSGDCCECDQIPIN